MLVLWLVVIGVGLAALLQVPWEEEPAPVEPPRPAVDEVGLGRDWLVAPTPSDDPSWTVKSPVHGYPMWLQSDGSIHYEDGHVEPAPGFIENQCEQCGRRVTADQYLGVGGQRCPGCGWTQGVGG